MGTQDFKPIIGIYARLPTYVRMLKLEVDQCWDANTQHRVRLFPIAFRSRLTSILKFRRRQIKTMCQPVDAENAADQKSAPKFKRPKPTQATTSRWTMFRQTPLTRVRLSQRKCLTTGLLTYSGYLLTVRRVQPVIQTHNTSIDLIWSIFSSFPFRLTI